MRVFAVLSVALVVSASVASARSVVGTPGNDRLLGTPRADVLTGLGGRDTLVGRSGADFLDGGPGRDVHDAGPGDDRIVSAYDGARDVVRCGPGGDVVNADLLDTVARDCELVGRRLSRDPYRNDGAQHETQVEPDSFTAGRTTVAVFQVGRRFDGAATNVGFAVTADDGATWTSGLLPGLTTASRPVGPNARASDPVVAYDAAHSTWLVSTLALGTGGVTRLAINRSTDGGRTWGTAIAAVEERADDLAFDKNWIACDNSPTSRFLGRCYLVYTHTSDRDVLAATWSDDGGLTWSTPVDIGARGGVGVFPAIRPDGVLAVVYLWQAGRPSIAASRSSDGGATWSTPVRLAQVDGGCRVRGFRAFSLPSAEVDRSGRFWAVWHDCEPAAGGGNAVWVATSADGISWTPAAAVIRGRNALLPAVGVDPASGRIAIAYMRSGPAGIDVDLVESPGPPGAFGAPRRLSARSMPLSWMPNTTSGRMLGDYISVHYAAGRPLVVWVLAVEPVADRFRQAVYATRG